MPFLLPNQQCQSTEGKLFFVIITTIYYYYKHEDTDRLAEWPEQKQGHVSPLEE